MISAKSSRRRRQSDSDARSIGPDGRAPNWDFFNFRLTNGCSSSYTIHNTAHYAQDELSILSSFIASLLLASALHVSKIMLLRDLLWSSDHTGFENLSLQVQNTAAPGSWEKSKCHEMSLTTLKRLSPPDIPYTPAHIGYDMHPVYNAVGHDVLSIWVETLASKFWVLSLLQDKA
jgi:hypothetical protein